VDRSAREVRLRTSKNGSPRTLPLEGELWSLIERRWASREYHRGTLTGLSDFVFHRSGKPVLDFRHAWSAARKDAGLPGKLFHDFRRTAVRDLIRAGTPQAVAMAITGHKTISIFNRYNITNGEDMREAIRRTQEYRATVRDEKNLVQFPQESASK
jgi:integrase